MNTSSQKIVRWFFSIFSLTLLLFGLAFLWHYIAPNGWIGIQPDVEMITDDDWYRYNERTGWALAFCGITLFFFTRMMRKEKSTTKLIIGSLITLLSSAALASLILELINQLINKTS
jgi:FtsH-binding integral membrane protein